MGKHYRKQKKGGGVAVKTRPQRVTSTDWEQLTGNAEMQSAFTRLSAEIQRAHAEASQLSARTGMPADALLDLSGAIAMVQGYPHLARFLYDVRENGAPYAQKASPVAVAQARDESQGIGDMAGWTADKHSAQGVVNARLFRRYADENEWARAAINVRRQQVGRANITVAPIDERKKFNKQTQYVVQQLLDQPNEYRTNYSELMGAVAEDLLVLDRGCISKDMTIARKPVNLYYEDGAAIKIYANWSGDPDEPRYVWQEPGGRLQVPLRNDELICMLANPASYRFGLSPVQVLMNTIKADLEATKTAMRMVSHKPPPSMVHLKGASPSQLAKLRDKYESDIAGEKELFWVGGDGDATLFPLVWSAKDQQFLEWQMYLARKICALFQISPQQVGITFDINKATADAQQEIFEDTGKIPLLLIFEEYLNRELLGDFAPQIKGGRVNFDALNLRILFPEISEADRRLHAERAVALAAQALAGLPSMTPNQVLALWGEEPVEGGNTFWVMTTNGPMPWLSYDGAYGDFNPNTVAGEQSATGGPSENSSTDEAANEVQDAPDDMTDNGADAAAASSDAADAAAASKRMDTQDYRGVGRRWTPSVQRSQRKARATGRASEAQIAAVHTATGKIKAREALRQATFDFYTQQTSEVVSVLQQVEGEVQKRKES